MTVVPMPTDPDAQRRMIRAALNQLREAFPGWAFTYDEHATVAQWVAAPGHAMLPQLRVLRSSAAVRAATAEDLAALLDTRR